MKLSNKIKQIPPGTSFDSWTVVAFSHVSTNKGKAAYWKCKCICGKLGILSGSMLRLGKSKRCKTCTNKLLKAHKYMHVPRKHLYMLLCDKYIKVGSTDNIEIRLKSIQASCPFPVSLIGYWKDYGYMEHTWQDALKDCHHSGEWFLIPKGGQCELN